MAIQPRFPTVNPIPTETARLEGGVCPSVLPVLSFSCTSVRPSVRLRSVRLVGFSLDGWTDEERRAQPLQERGSEKNSTGFAVHESTAAKEKPFTQTNGSRILHPLCRSDGRCKSSTVRMQEFHPPEEEREGEKERGTASDYFLGRLFGWMCLLFCFSELRIDPSAL